MQTILTQSLDSKTSTTPYSVSVLIVAKSDPPRDSLRILLETKPWISVIAQTEDNTKVMEMVNRHRPALVILDTNVSPDSGDWISILEEIQTKTSQTSCLVLTNTARKQRMAGESGAHPALIKGYPAEKLFEAITEMV